MRISVLVIAFGLCFSLHSSLFSQTPDNPVEYMDYLNKRDAAMSEKYLSYMSEVAHGHRARKMEKRRQELTSEIKSALQDANKLKPYKGDATLRDAYRTYWDILLKVFNEDYHKIVDMEEIAEQSYDNMEAYLLAQEKAEEVLDNASDQIPPVYRAFAEKNNIKLIEKDNKTNKKLRQVGLVNNYYHQLFLIFFKSYKQEAYMLDAFNKNDINGMEQNRLTLIRFADEGLEKLKAIKPFQDDGSLVTACRKVLEFHKNEASRIMPGQSDFLLKQTEFEKLKKAMDAKPQNKRTQADVDMYNKAVNDFNAAINMSNTSLQNANKEREKVMNNWETTTRRFMDQHTPKGN
jgi:hypothetical protein